MRISRNKKILVTAITVFSISAIGISINAFAGAFSLDSMSRDAKYKTDAYISRAGDEIENEDENEYEDETSPENQGDENSPDIDAVTSATPDADEPGGEFKTGDEVLINPGDTAFDIESSATPKETQIIPGKPSSQNTSINQNTQAADVVSSATPKTGSAAAAGSSVQSAAGAPSAPGVVPASGVDVVSSATPKAPSAGSTTTSPPSSPGSSTGTSAGITSDAAKKIVLDKIPGASITNCELDEDDGILIYEIEAYVGQNKYTFKVNANTGAILSYEEDIADTEDADEPDEPDNDGDDEESGGGD